MRARAFAKVRVLGYIAEHSCEFHPDDVEWMIQVVTLAVELRWANRALSEGA